MKTRLTEPFFRLGTVQSVREPVLKPDTKNVRKRPSDRLSAKTCTVAVPTESKRGRQEQVPQEVNPQKVKSAYASTSFQADTVNLGHKLVENFKAGRLQEHYSCWEQLTSDPNILHIANGYSIEFHTQPYQSKIPKQFESDKTTKINREVRNMCNKGIIEKIPDNQARFVSNIFTRPKSDNTLRIILDLTELNEFVTYKHFKMDNLPTAIDCSQHNDLTVLVLQRVSKTHTVFYPSVFVLPVYLHWSIPMSSDNFYEK